jgi:CPA1 family monovalent cation:H+ antiporter
VGDGADEMPDPATHTLRAEVFGSLYLDVLRAQRAALIAERDDGHIEDESAHAMLERL